MTLAGIEYPDKDLDFTNILCDLEDMGFDVMGMLGNQEELNKHAFSFCRAIISVYTGEKDLTECGKILSRHIAGGGKMVDIVNAFTDSMVRAGFGGAEELPVTPQDHKRKQTKKADEE